MANYSSDDLFITILNPKYRKEFVKALDDMSFWVRVPPYMAVTPANSIFRRPFWTWLKKSVIDYYDAHQKDIFDILGLRSDISPQALAWYCTLLTAYGMLKNSPSCRCYDAKDKLSQWGENIQSFISGLGNYAIENNLVSKNECTQIIGDLLSEIPGSTFYRSNPSSPPKNINPPSQPKSPPSENDSESERYKDFKLSPIEDSSEDISPSKKKQTKSSYRPLILAALTLALLIGFLALFSDPIPNSVSSSAQSESVNSTSSKPTPNTTDLAVLPKPSTGLIRSYDNAEAVAPFDVTASAGRDYFLVLSQNGKAKRCYYIRHGETLSVSVPLGTYDLYYASATVQAAWHGSTGLWGTNTEFYKSTDIWEFTLEDDYYTGYTLSLTKTSNGNTHSNETSAYTWDSLFE